MSIFYYILFFIFILIFPFIISSVLFFLYFYFIKDMRFKKGVSKKVSNGSILRRLYYDFPKMFILDKFNCNPDEFTDFGVHIIAGKQGSGKSITMTYLLMKYKKQFPRIKIATNYYFKNEDFHFSGWKDIISYNNGIYGVIISIDEIQNWFNSLQSKDFPPEMMTEITQQRKQRKIIFGTSQVFTRVAKPIREQTYMLYEPTTIFGCLTFVRKYEIETNTDGLTSSKKFRGLFFFVQTKKIRNAFDTYKKIEDLSNSGFKDENNQFNNISNTTIIDKPTNNIFKR